jgi:hypothetical protein
MLPAKADPDRQAAYLTHELEPRLAQAQAGQRAVFFVDAAHFVLAPFLGFLWSLTRVFLRAPAGRQRFNVLGALNALTHELVTVTNDTDITATEVCTLLRQLAALNLAVPLTIVLDNARYQRCARNSTGGGFMFEGFTQTTLTTSGATINLIKGGQGSPVLLLHGYPQSHVMWHKIAPQLAKDFFLVMPDLRGYGDSSKPADGDNHSGYCKRATAQDQVEVMEQLGFKHFAVVGHDRGGRVAHRLTLDHADRVTKLATLDIVPTHKLYNDVTKEMASVYYHWFFLIQPAPFPETLIGNNAEVTAQLGGVRLSRVRISDRQHASYARPRATNWD